jgi:hypothetical protein
MQKELAQICTDHIRAVIMVTHNTAIVLPIAVGVELILIPSGCEKTGFSKKPVFWALVTY